MHGTTKHLLTTVVVILYFTTTCANITCAPQCQITKYTIKCINKNLTTIPKSLPRSARRINLSNNPNINISSCFFLQFKNLFILTLTRCGQRGPFYLPHTVRELRLDDNEFTIDALRQMLSKLKSLKLMSVARNNLHTSDIKSLLSILPKGLEHLTINGNELKKLTARGMHPFTKIKTLKIEQCSLESIEKGAFDTLRRLVELRLGGNILLSLPDNLFKFNSKLHKIWLGENKIEEFNATKLCLNDVQDLRLANNRIRNFDIRNLRPNIVMLHGNKIQKLEYNMFNNNTGVLALTLNNNKIQRISRYAFHGVEGIGNLLLNNNSIMSLPDDLFAEMTVNYIFLQNNKLSSLNGTFHGMKTFPYILMLSGNRGITSLNGRDFRSLPHKSNIYLNCERFTNISNLFQLKTKVHCSPKADEVIETSVCDGLSCNGYECKRLWPYEQFKCMACRPGYKNVCVMTHNYNSKCIECPPGSYYQDEPASITCKTCRPGQFVPPEHGPGKSASDCQTCPEGTNTAILAGTRACNCLNGYSRRYRFGPCLKCTENGFNCSQDYPILQNGFWMTWQGTTLEHTAAVGNKHVTHKTCENVYKAYIRNLDITDDSYNRATMHFNCQMPLPLKCPMHRSCLGGIQPRCFLGYTGVLCAVCKHGYTRQFNQCVQCPQKFWAATHLIGCMALFLIIVFLISWADNSGVVSARNYGRKPTDHGTYGDIILSSLKILVGHYHVLICIVNALSKVHWPENLKPFISILQYIQLEIINFTSLRCINSEWNINAFDELWITLIIIITIPLLAVVYYFISASCIYYTCSCPSEVKRRRFTYARNCIRYFALFLFVAYIVITTKIIGILPISCHSFCTAKQNGICVHSMSFLRSDYSITCPTMKYNRGTLTTAYSSLILPVGMPIFLWFLL